MPVVGGRGRRRAFGSANPEGACPGARLGVTPPRPSRPHKRIPPAVVGSARIGRRRGRGTTWPSARRVQSGRATSSKAPGDGVGRGARGCSPTPRSRGPHAPRTPAGRTSPEELLAAAHAACFSMALSNELSSRGHEPSRPRGVGGGGRRLPPTITTMRLHVTANGPGGRRGPVPGGGGGGGGLVPGVERAPGQRRRRGRRRAGLTQRRT